jgi:hypothetical protein
MAPRVRRIDNPTRSPSIAAAARATTTVTARVNGQFS